MRKPVIAIVALLGIIVPGVTPADHSAGNRSISGTVTDEDGAPLADICATAYDADEWWSAEGISGPDGRYEITYLQAGSYRVHFQDCSWPQTYLDEWYDDAADIWSATIIEVPDGADVSGIDAMLARGGAITGVVTDEGTGRPVEGLCVTAEGDATYRHALAYTRPDGTYRLGALPTDAYRVRFGCEFPIAVPVPETERGGSGASITSSVPWHEDDYIDEWYDDVATYDAATLVPVLLGVDTPGIDAALVVGGRISGFVAGPDGRPADAICVDAVESSTGRWSGSTVAYGGDYVVRGLRAGTYRVSFADCGYGRFASEWYDDAPSFGTATDVEVALGVTTLRIDAVLALRPVPDLAVTDLRVDPVPLRTDAATLPGPGTLRDVTVEVANLGNAPSMWGTLQVWAEMRSDGATFMLGEIDLDGLEHGEHVSERFRWDGFGAVGDARVVAQVCSAYEDRSLRNNRREVDSYLIVGGTGQGRSVVQRRPRHYPCDGPVVVRPL